MCIPVVFIVILYIYILNDVDYIKSVPQIFYFPIKL